MLPIILFYLFGVIYLIGQVFSSYALWSRVYIEARELFKFEATVFNQDRNLKLFRLGLLLSYFSGIIQVALAYFFFYNDFALIAFSIGMYFIILSCMNQVLTVKEK